METTRSNHHAHKGKNDLADDFLKVKESLTQTASHLSDRASDMLKGAQEKTEDAQDYVVKYVKTHPFKSVGYSLLAGFVAAFLFRK